MAPIARVYTNTGNQPGQVAASAIIATISVAQGAYAVSFGGYFTGTALAADYDNMVIQSDPQTQGVFVNSQVLLLQPIAANSTSGVPPVISKLPIYAISTIQIIAVAQGSASCNYHASIAAAYPGTVGSLI